MTIEVKDFLVYLIELCSENFFNGDKSLAYSSLKKHGLLDFYKDTYDTSHTLSSGYILDEISEKLNIKRVAV
jgi:hypothetical protein